MGIPTSLAEQHWVRPLYSALYSGVSEGRLRVPFDLTR